MRAGSKANLAEVAPSLAFEIVAAANGTAQVRWLGTSSCSASDILNAATGAHDSALGDAVSFLTEELTPSPKPANEIERAAAEAGISRITLQRAKKVLGFKVIREGGLGKTGHWAWALPGSPAVSASSGGRQIFPKATMAFEVKVSAQFVITSSVGHYLASR